MRRQAAIIAIGWLFATAEGYLDYRGRPLGTDFINIYSSGTLVARGEVTAPYDLRGNKWQTMKKMLLDTALKTMDMYAPRFASLVSASAVVTPLDYEETYGYTQGSLSHGQMGLDQLLLMRPVPGFSGYQSPVDGLYLCGPSSHPGGGGSGMPGWKGTRSSHSCTHSSSLPSLLCGIR